MYYSTEKRNGDKKTFAIGYRFLAGVATLISVIAFWVYQFIRN